MFARALIVLLLALNLGVAAWWALRPTVEQPAVSALPAGTPGLQLLRESTPSSRASDVARAPHAPPPAPQTASSCVAFGPFADATTAAHAGEMLRTQVTRMRVRAAPGSGHGWRVWLPPLADHAAAQAMAARLAAAGFKDYYIQSGPDELNAIALGRYGNEDSARRRQAALLAAGVQAQAEALGAPMQWIDAMVPAGLDVDGVRTRAGAARAQPLDCATLP